MKKFLIVALMAVISASAQAMPYMDARNEALYLSDKMAYELNLSMAQLDAVYEINFDYFYSVNRRSDVMGKYWRRRNTDMRYVLSISQFSRYRAIAYFYNPLLWQNNSFFFRIYTHYYDRDFLYFERPRIFVDYRGGHSGRSYYSGRVFDNGPRPQPFDRNHPGTSWRSYDGKNWNANNRSTPNTGTNNRNNMQPNNQPNNRPNSQGGSSWRLDTSGVGNSSAGNNNVNQNNKSSSSGSGASRGSFGGSRNSQSSADRSSGSKSSGSLGSSRSNSSTRSSDSNNGANAQNSQKSSQSSSSQSVTTTGGGNFGGKRTK